MAGLETGIELLERIFFNSNFAGQSWVIYLTIICASLLIITRHLQDWGELGLPVMVGWRYFGMPIPTTFLVVGSVIFVLSILSLKVIGASLGTLGERITSTRDKRKFGVRKDIKAEMTKLKREKVDTKLAEIKKAGGLLGYEKKMKKKKMLEDIKKYTRQRKAWEELNKKNTTNIDDVKQMVFTSRRDNE